MINRWAIRENTLTDNSIYLLGIEGDKAGAELVSRSLDGFCTLIDAKIPPFNFVFELAHITDDDMLEKIRVRIEQCISQSNGQGSDAGFIDDKTKQSINLDALQASKPADTTQATSYARISRATSNPEPVEIPPTEVLSIGSSADEDDGLSLKLADEEPQSQASNEHLSLADGDMSIRKDFESLGAQRIELDNDLDVGDGTFIDLGGGAAKKIKEDTVRAPVKDLSDLMQNTSKMPVVGKENDLKPMNNADIKSASSQEKEEGSFFNKIFKKFGNPEKTAAKIEKPKEMPEDSILSSNHKPAQPKTETKPQKHSPFGGLFSKVLGKRETKEADKPLPFVEAAPKQEEVHKFADESDEIADVFKEKTQPAQVKQEAEKPQAIKPSVRPAQKPAFAPKPAPKAQGAHHSAVVGNGAPAKVVEDIKQAQYVNEEISPTDIFAPASENDELMSKMPVDDIFAAETICDFYANNDLQSYGVDNTPDEIQGILKEPEGAAVNEEDLLEPPNLLGSAPAPKKTQTAAKTLDTGEKVVINKPALKEAAAPAKPAAKPIEPAPAKPAPVAQKQEPQQKTQEEEHEEFLNIAAHHNNGQVVEEPQQEQPHTDAESAPVFDEMAETELESESIENDFDTPQEQPQPVLQPKAKPAPQVAAAAAPVAPKAAFVKQPTAQLKQGPVLQKPEAVNRPIPAGPKIIAAQKPFAPKPAPMQRPAQPQAVPPPPLPAQPKAIVKPQGPIAVNGGGAVNIPPAPTPVAPKRVTLNNMRPVPAVIAAQHPQKPDLKKEVPKQETNRDIKTDTKPKIQEDKNEPTEGKTNMAEDNEIFNLAARKENAQQEEQQPQTPAAPAKPVAPKAAPAFRQAPAAPIRPGTPNTVNIPAQPRQPAAARPSAPAAPQPHPAPARPAVPPTAVQRPAMQQPKQPQPAARPAQKPLQPVAKETFDKTTTMDHTIQIESGKIYKKSNWPIEMPLIPTFTFDNMDMSSNRFVHATAMSVIESLGTMYNPFLLYGESGTGKTHFLNAIGYEISKRIGQDKILFTNGVRLARGVQRYVEENKTDRLESFLNSTEVLIIDDIHLTAVNEHNREFISRLLNSFQRDKRQIIMASKYAPEGLARFEELVQFKLAQGWCSEIKQPSSSHFTKIYTKMVEAAELEIKDVQAQAFFGDSAHLGSISRNIRRAKVLHRMIAESGSMPKSYEEILTSMLAVSGEDESSEIIKKNIEDIVTIQRGENKDWGSFGFFFPQESADKFKWLASSIMQRAKEFGIKGGFDFALKSAYSTQNVISSAFKIANICDNKNLKGAIILGPALTVCPPAIRDNFYDILTHMLEVMNMRCGIVDPEYIKHPSAYTKVLGDVLK